MMKKATLLKSIAIGLFAVLMAFNITMTLNTTSDANIDVSLSGIKAMAQGGGEDDEDQCKLQVFQQNDEVCFICVDDTQGSNCTSPCGSKTCYEPGEE